MRGAAAPVPPPQVGNVAAALAAYALGGAGLRWWPQAARPAGSCSVRGVWLCPGRPGLLAAWPAGAGQAEAHAEACPARCACHVTCGVHVLGWHLLQKRATNTESKHAGWHTGAGPSSWPQSKHAALASASAGAGAQNTAVAWLSACLGDSAVGCAAHLARPAVARLMQHQLIFGLTARPIHSRLCLRPVVLRLLNNCAAPCLPWSPSLQLGHTGSGSWPQQVRAHTSRQLLRRGVWGHPVPAQAQAPLLPVLHDGHALAQPVLEGPVQHGSCNACAQQACRMLSSGIS